MMVERVERVVVDNKKSHKDQDLKKTFFNFPQEKWVRLIFLIFLLFLLLCKTVNFCLKVHLAKKDFEQTSLRQVQVYNKLLV